jgi:Tfp pilus assembly protein PilO
MSSPLRASRTRALAGVFGLLGALLVLLFVLPDASARKQRELRARQDAQALRDRQKKDLEQMKALDQRLRQDREVLADLESRLPSGNSGDLQWSLSRALHELAAKSGVRLQSVKYSAPTKEGGLEAVDVEFTALSVYPQLKAFMLSVEGAGLPFAVRDARLEESPEGARLTVVLRAFRPRSGKEGEEV